MALHRIEKKIWWHIQEVLYMNSSFPGAFMRSKQLRKEQNMTQTVYLWKRRNEASYADKPSVSKQPGHLCDAADILLAVPSWEAQVFVQAVPNIIAVQRIAGDAMRDQVLFQSKANGCLTGSRKACWRQESEVPVWKWGYGNGTAGVTSRKSLVLSEVEASQPSSVHLHI